MKKIFVINLGSTSTKIAYFEDDKCIFKETLKHNTEDIKQFKSIWEQEEYRKNALDKFMLEHNIKVSKLDAIVSRGGHTEPLHSGVYLINQKMLDESRSMKYGNHVSDLGILLASKYAKEGPIPLTVDTACTDEFEPLAVVNKNPDEDIVVVSKSEWDSIQETLRIVQNKELSDKVLRGMAQVRAGETQEHALKE